MGKIKKYKKLPIAIEAIQYTGANFDELYEWGCPDGDVLKAKILQDDDGISTTDLWIETLEGGIRAKIGDYIIRGIAGEFYPCNRDIFEKTYEEMEE